MGKAVAVGRDVMAASRFTGVRGLILIAMMASLVLGGCGISETRTPEKVGDAAVPDLIDAVGTEQIPPGPDASSSAQDLVTSFFTAAVGGDQDAEKRARAFLDEDAADQFNPNNELNVVRLGDVASRTEKNGDLIVTVSLHRIGRLEDGGIFRASSSPSSGRLVFHVKEHGPDTNITRLRITTPLPQMETLMISDSALAAFYILAPVYYWSSGSERILVPDYRWLPETLPVLQRANWLVEALLLRGPSPLVEPAVTRPTGSGLRDTVDPGEGAIVVNVSSNVVSENPEAQQRFADQLRWTLKDYAQGIPVELRVEGQPKPVDGSTDFRTGAMPELFSMDEDGAVVVQPAGTKSGVLDAGANSDVKYAAVSVDANSTPTRAVFVTRTGKVLIVTQDASERSSPKPVSLPGRPPADQIGRPTWLPGGERFLIPAAGKLYVVGLNGRSVRVRFNPKLTIQSVALAPDGRRIAVATTSGAAYVAALTVDKNGVSIPSSPQPLVGGILKVEAVAWSSPHHVLVGGANAKGDEPRLFRVTADGALVVDESPSPDESPIIDVVAAPNYTVPPQDTSGTSRGETYATAENGLIFNVFGKGKTRTAERVGAFYASGEKLEAGP